MPSTTMTEDRSFAPPAADIDPAEVLGFLDPLDALGPAGHLGPRTEIEKELDLIAAAIRTFHAKQPDQVMRECAGYSARLTEMCVLLHRVEASSREYTRIRTQQAERFLAEIDRQFKIASRLVEIARQDIDLLRGQR